MSATRDGHKRKAPARQQTQSEPAQSRPLGEIAEAIEFERTIAERAGAIWEEHGAAGMTRDLFHKLWPLLKEPIPEGFLVHTTKGTGKPYESDGIRSVQVCVDRMDNVLGPMWWDYREHYEQDGRLCTVEVFVLDDGGRQIVRRSSCGGVDRGSTIGNVYKGSFTNAAKVAFARLGPGHEVYLGAIDYDPDVNEEVAKEQVTPPRRRELRDATDAQTANGRAGNSQVDEAIIATLLAQDGPLRDKRRQADEGMRRLGAGPSQRLRELQDHGADERVLDALIIRIKNATDAGQGS